MSIIIDVTEMQDTYDNFLEIEKNQIEIFMQLRRAMLTYAGLTAFSGKGADAAKAYISETHVPVVDGFNSAMMELEIRLMNLIADFSQSVDNDDVALLNTDYINDALIRNMVNYRVECSALHASCESAISGVRSQLGLSSHNIAIIDDHLEDTEDAAQKAVDSMEDFESRHKDDLNEIQNRIFPAISSAIQYMNSIKKGKEFSYSAGDSAGQDCFGDIEQYNLGAVQYAESADPEFENMIYAIMVADTGMYTQALILQDMAGDEGIDYNEYLEILKILDSGTDVGSASIDTGIASKKLIEYIKLVRSGLKFETVGNKYENIFVKVTSNVGDLSDADIKARLAKAGMNTEKIGSPTLKKLLSSKGLCVYTENGTSYKSLIFDKIKPNWQGLSEISNQVRSGDFTSAAGRMSKTGKLWGKISKGANATAFVVGVLADIPIAIRDKRTGELSSQNVDWDKFTGALTVDILELGVTAGTKIASKVVFGSSGSLPGAIAGLVVGMADIVTYGEPPKSFADRVGERIGDTYKSIVRGIKRLFN
jgi:hypothetical protein